MKKQFEYNFFVADEGDGVYNIFAYDDFDKDGYYMEHHNEGGYHIDDFDIVANFRSFEKADAWVNEHSF